MVTTVTLAPERVVRPQLNLDLQPTVAEFFAGIGLVRMGLERAGFRCVWANDFDPQKKEMYRTHFKGSGNHYFSGDVADVDIAKMPRKISLAWASFPCIDVSLAGWRRGLNGKHTGTFWHFIRVMNDLKRQHRLPAVVALENVSGLATSHGGKDLVDAIMALNEIGYSVDVLALDARHFVPQSRPRLFLVGALSKPIETQEDDLVLRPARLQAVFDNPSLVTHKAALPRLPPPLTAGLADVVDPLPAHDERWWDAKRTTAFLESLSPVQKKRLEQLMASKRLAHRTAYRRTRDGKPMWEMRADEIAGCLRTARGGSSKQALVQVNGNEINVRWMTEREYARLMGARDYNLDGLRRNQALFGFGDAVCVDVVEWLARHYLRPLVEAAESNR
ncbi:DNA cytosine methyltransferase [Planotetraspora sp. A-T 1434]|uniref:DNA cytosine methyltransferase n=1 Tax=Planotetraspora sp. A-T 1434 TaxID=2979219 RepID=UPI0021BF3A8C|nr:DNA cytosine methyltransferase [Planotetraspora sp. A-T 1434]MCT9931447.1 DNA cytosine methyltransferase [Planotetraspora sp. A-T 1434]